jgi:transcriptional regulator with XRE-family HTH domain
VDNEGSLEAKPLESFESLVSSTDLLGYLIGYLVKEDDVKPGALIKQARLRAGLSQSALAQAAGTSRTTISAYEHGHKSPTLETAERLLGHVGYEMALDRRVDFVQRTTKRGRPFCVPTALPRLTADQALATVTLPLHLNWSQSKRRWRLAQRQERARVYEAVLSEGTPADIQKYVDGLLLVDLWEELVLPLEVRNGWEQLIQDALTQTW